MTKKRALAADKEPATRKDFRALNAKIDATRRGLGAKIDAMRQGLDAKISDLSAVTRRIALDVASIKGKMAEMQDFLTEIKKDTRNMQEIAADFMSRSGHDHTAVLLHGEALTEVRVQCRDHEGRIQRLEASKPPA